MSSLPPELSGPMLFGYRILGDPQISVLNRVFECQRSGTPFQVTLEDLHDSSTVEETVVSVEYVDHNPKTGALGIDGRLGSGGRFHFTINPGPEATYIGTATIRFKF